MVYFEEYRNWKVTTLWAMPARRRVACSSAAYARDLSLSSLVACGAETTFCHVSVLVEWQAARSNTAPAVRVKVVFMDIPALFLV
jgi:hypothetical protein